MDTSVTGGFHACQKLLRKSGIKVQIYKRFATINGSEPINNSFITGCFEVRLELYRCNEMSARLYVHKGETLMDTRIARPDPRKAKADIKSIRALYKTLRSITIEKAGTKRRILRLAETLRKKTLVRNSHK